MTTTSLLSLSHSCLLSISQVLFEVQRSSQSGNIEEVYCQPIMFLDRSIPRTHLQHEMSPNHAGQVSSHDCEREPH